MPRLQRGKIAYAAMRVKIILGVILMFVASGAAGNSRLGLIARQKNLAGRVMWFDAEANLLELSTRKGVAETVAKCKSVNINTIVVDVKPLSGLVLYKSKIAPRLIQSKGRAYPRDYDLLRTVVEEGHKAGIKVHAAINVFSEGSQKISGGPALKHPDWQCVQYGMDRRLMSEDGTAYKFDSTGEMDSTNKVYMLGDDPESVGKLPENTFYVRVARDGTILQSGTATGFARISRPEGGYVATAKGKAAEWLKQVAEKSGKLTLEAKPVLRRVAEDETTHHAIFVNPLHPEARAYALSIIREITENYPVDGIILDRMRYPNIYSDFSDITKAAFEEYIGKKVRKWPDDVYKRDDVPGNDTIKGPLFKEWIKFRAKVMRDFLAEARDEVKSRKPEMALGIYVGSWYPLYYDVGVNWGSPKNKSDYEWWPDGYESTGYADLLDYICTGCYYIHPTRAEAVARGDEEWKSVEAAAEESVKAVGDDTFVYGSLYLFQYHGNPEKFAQAIRQCEKHTQGCMIFDLVYVRKYNWWNILKSAFSEPKKAPHDIPGLLNQLRQENK